MAKVRTLFGVTPLSRHRHAVFTMKLEPELRADFVHRQREARGYDEFLSRKVDAARTSMRAGLGHSNEEVEAMFAARRGAVAVAGKA